MILEHVLVLSAYLFSIGIYGLITTAIGLAIVSSIYRNRKSTRINQSNLLNN
ncbi:unnamed protein product [Withania somnifera]